MNENNDRYCVLFAKNLLLPGSYAIPVYSHDDARFVFEQVKEAAESGVNVSFYDISESDDRIFVPDEYGLTIKNNAVILIYERFPLRIFADMLPFICIHDVGLFIKKAANLSEYKCQENCRHGEYMELYSSNAMKCMIASSILNDGAVAGNVERYVKVTNDEIIQADRLRTVTDIVQNVSKIDADRYLNIPNDLYELAEKSHVRTRNLSNNMHEKQEKIEIKMDAEEYIVATHESLPGCCAISYKNGDIDEILSIVDHYGIELSDVYLKNAEGINEIMKYGIAIFEVNPEEFVRVAGLMKPCSKQDICSTHDYMIQQAANAEKIKFISRCMMDEHYLADPKDYISPVYDIELTQAKTYCSLASRALNECGGDIRELISYTNLDILIRNNLNSDILEDLIKEIRDRIELQCKNGGNDE